MMNNIEYLDINDVNLLKRFFSHIKALFAECFGVELSKELWEWAYLNNPCGTPLVSLAIADGKVVGHYAVIPQSLVNGLDYIDGYLSMTTMVSSEFRRHGLFKILAERVYTNIEKNARLSVVYGFPNDNSVSGFRKRLGWTIADEYHVVQINYDDWNRTCETIKNGVEEDAYRLNMDDKAIREWRCNKPGQTWNIQSGIGLKNISDAMDLMYYDSPEILSDILVDKPINILLPLVTTNEMVGGVGDVLFRYRFGYRTFNMVGNPSFCVHMCMSDVF
jgi:hypothetical protein